MSAIEDPAAEPSPEAARADERSDALEHWLSDLRTEVAADPSRWRNEEAAGPADEPDPPAPGRRGDGGSAPSGGGGRHRAPD